MTRPVRALGRRWLRRRAWTPRWARMIVAAGLCAYLLLALVAPPSSPGSGNPRHPDQTPPPGAIPTVHAQPGKFASIGGAPTKLPNAPLKSPEPQPPGAPTTRFPTSPQLVAQGQTLYENGCASCHGTLLQGIHGNGPSLIGVGPGPVDFYLSSGRMPLDNPLQEPTRTAPAYSRGQIYALIAFITRVGGGPPAPAVDIAKGSLSTGFQVFVDRCAGCHQLVARGGMTVGAWVPNLQDASALQVAEAVRMGPYLMPHFDAKQIDQYQLDSLARYVLWTRHPSNAGGWGIYNIGPIPEGIVTFFIGLLALLVVARLIGERLTTQ